MVTYEMHYFIYMAFGEDKTVDEENRPVVGRNGGWGHWLQVGTREF